MSEDSTLVTRRGQSDAKHGARPVPALAVLWSRSEPGRIGEVAVPLADDARGDGGLVFGRGGGAGALELMQQRATGNVPTGPLAARSVSRQQWRVHVRRGGLEIENLGRRELLHNGTTTGRALARVGDLVEMRGELLMLVVARPAALPPTRPPDALVPPFGEADRFGIVGESPVAWELRRQLAFAAGRDDHVLLTGPSGSGKELAATAIHRLSRRGDTRMVARNAATLPDALIDAELFGNVRDYPNPGMPERPGLVGAADRSTLFLDEIGEAPHAAQAHLLRLIDGGEYHRLGEARARRADLRVIAATNRDPTAVKHDVLARLRLRVRLPGLDRRREDIPLIARHLLRTLAAHDPLVAERAFPGGDVDAPPAWTGAFVAELVTASYATHVRELHARLWEAIGRSHGGGLSTAAPSELELTIDDDSDSLEGGEVDPANITGDQLVAALEASGGNRERAWRALGLRSRHQLLRLMRRHGIDAGSTSTGRS